MNCKAIQITFQITISVEPPVIVWKLPAGMCSNNNNNDKNKKK